MNTAELNDVIAWIKTTDLVEVSFKEGKQGFSFQTAPQAVSVPYYFSGARLSPVTAEAVGIFQWNDAGKARGKADGASVAAGDLLGVIDLGIGKKQAVKAPVAGKLSKTCVDAGDAVQYGQPLFFIEQN
jgi:biotin carboxyl carrier protein